MSATTTLLGELPRHPVRRSRPSFQRARLKVYNALAVKRGAMADHATGALVEPTSDQSRDVE